MAFLDDYEDIVPNSLRPSDEDMHRLVHFWEMHTRPLECEFKPAHLLVDELGDASFMYLWLCLAF